MRQAKSRLVGFASSGFAGARSTAAGQCGVAIDRFDHERGLRFDPSLAPFASLDRGRWASDRWTGPRWARPLKAWSGITPLWHITLPDLDENSAESHFAPLVFALMGMVGVNRWHLERAFRRYQAGLDLPYPPLYASGVVYQEDPPGREDWRDIPAILRRGVADCDQLVSWRCAELNVAGIAAEPVIKWQHLDRATAAQAGYPPTFVPPEGLWLVHCCVRFPDGSVEDPSKNLGMGGNFTRQI